MATTTEKKIAIRKAPIEKAKTYDVGFITIGEDKQKYIVTVDKNNSKRWMKTKTEVEVFFEAPEIVVEPKRTYKKKQCKPCKPCEPCEPCETLPVVEEEPAAKPKRAYNKKIVKQYAEMGTQTEEVKKPRQPRAPKN